MRSRALSRMTQSASRPLLFCTASPSHQSSEVLSAFLESGQSDYERYVDDRAPTRRASASSLPNPRERSPGRSVRSRRWLLTLARFMARPREFEERQAATVRIFAPQKFRQEWELLWELCDPIAEAVERTRSVSQGLELALPPPGWNGLRLHSRLG